jgi:hypothetical protein
LPGEYYIKVDPNVTPRIHPPRRVEHALKPKVKEELGRMVIESDHKSGKTNSMD